MEDLKNKDVFDLSRLIVVNEDGKYNLYYKPKHSRTDCKLLITSFELKETLFSDLLEWCEELYQVR